MSVETPLGADRPLLGTVLRRRWFAVVVAAVACAVVGVVVGSALARTYRSTATVLIAPLEGDPYSPESVGRQSQASTDALTDSRLAATPAVARLVEDSLGLARDSLAWRSKLSVDIVPNSQVVKITYGSSNAGRARETTQAFAAGYLRYRANVSRASVSGQLSELEARERQAQKRLTAARRATAAGHTAAHRASLNQQVTIYTDQLAALAVQTAQVSGASQNPGQMLTPATNPVAKGLPTPALAVIGAIAGLLLGLAFAVVREAGDHRLREAMEVESAGLPLLATLKARRNSPPDADETERYRMLRTAVLTNAPAPRVIAVSALSPTTASGDVAAGLGTALARAGNEATVVLALPESNPSSGDRAGLAEVLLEGLDAQAVRRRVAPELYLLEPGRQIEAAAEMFASENLKAVLHGLAGTSGYVLVAAPAAGTAHSAALAAVCDEVILVCQLDASTSEQLTAAMREVQRLRGQLLGAVAVEPTTRGRPSLRRVASSLPQIDRVSLARWRSLVPTRGSRNLDTEGRLRALSTVAAALEHRLAQVRSGNGHTDRDGAQTSGASSGEETVNAARATSEPVPAAARKRSSNKRRSARSRRRRH